MSYLVIKCGGSVLDNMSQTFFENVVEIMKRGQFKPIIVHGGGPNISKLLNQLEIETTFINGMRVTTERVLNVVEMVLSGTVNKTIVRKIIESNGDAFGLSGVDGMLLEAKQLGIHKELGYVGEIVSVNKNLLIDLLQMQMIPVISPIATDKSGQHWNINGDTAAAAIACELHASLCLVTNVSGVIKDGEVLPSIQMDVAKSMLKDDIITGGMIPKVCAAMECIQAGVNEVTIINGNEENALIKLVNGEKVGTKIMEGMTC